MHHWQAKVPHFNNRPKVEIYGEFLPRTDPYGSTLYKLLPLGIRLQYPKYCTRVKEVKGVEIVYNNIDYNVCIVLYPKGQKIVHFEKIMKELDKEHEGLMLPVFVLVSNGVFGNWFALYFRKEKLK